MLSGSQKATSAVADAPRQLELLAHYELDDPKTGDSRSGFAVILELTDRRLLLEGDAAFSAGAELRVSFFLPDPQADSGRVNVALRCIVAQCCDATKLHYGVRISKISEAAKKAISSFDPEASGDSR